MSHYAVFKSNQRLPRDLYVDRRVNRAAASRIACELNRQAVQRQGKKAPLYYVLRIGKGRTA